MRLLSLVAFYGTKPAEFGRLVLELQRKVARGAGDGFAPYDLAQVHATLVGLETEDGVNRNLLRHRGLRRPMDLAGLLGRLREAGSLPLRLRIGGFAPDEAPFLSRGALPYERGFSIQGDKAVAMGWPRAPRALDALRREAQRFHVLHAYHRSPEDVDDDCYFRLGTIDRERLDPAERVRIECDVRDALAGMEPLYFEIAAHDVAIVAYEDETLPPATTRALPLLEAVDPAVVERLLDGA